MFDGYLRTLPGTQSLVEALNAKPHVMPDRRVPHLSCHGKLEELLDNLVIKDFTAPVKKNIPMGKPSSPGPKEAW